MGWLVIPVAYTDFLATKAQRGADTGIRAELPDWLFDFQRDLVQWALVTGRAAVFADCGLGKTPMALAWAQAIHHHTRKPVLILTPLAVAHQFAQEATKFGIDAAVSRDGTTPAPITITNYERLNHFTPDRYGAVVCDESSAIKAFNGQRRAEVTEFLRQTPYRLLATATAAPNDYIELGTSSEALGHLGYTDMLNRFFVNDMRNSASGRAYGQMVKWRFKGHAQTPFWQWMASWSRAMRKPSDLGYSDDGFNLPPLEYRTHTVAALTPKEGTLFDLPAIGMVEEREETRRTITQRCELAAQLLADAPTAVAWCHLNEEGKLLTKLIDGAVEVSGVDPPDEKEEKLIAFGNGQIRVLVTKPKIGAFGLNWQHCHRMAYFPSHSYEQHYQAVRRCWRYGQQHPVTVDMVTTPGGQHALDNLRRKSDQAVVMFDQLVTHMRQSMNIGRAKHTQPPELPQWLS